VAGLDEVASRLSVVVPTPEVSVISRRMFQALTPSSAPWSMTFTVSSGPRIERVTWMPPVPQPRATGISRDPNGTWWPGRATPFRSARRTSRFVVSSRKAKL
jgi:hypothetical protein